MAEGKAPVVVVLHNNAEVRQSLQSIPGFEVKVLPKSETEQATTLILTGTVRYVVCTSSFDFSAVAGRCRIIIWSKTAQGDVHAAQKLRNAGAWWVAPADAPVKILLDTILSDFSPPNFNVAPKPVGIGGCNALRPRPALRPLVVVPQSPESSKRSRAQTPDKNPEAERARVQGLIQQCLETKASKLNLAGTTLHYLPDTIGQLTHLRELNLYSSSLRALPPAIGNLTNLVTLCPYTSYDLHYLPFEVLRCKKVTAHGFTVSIRALYDNHKNRMPLPKLCERVPGPLSLTELASRVVIKLGLEDSADLPADLRTTLAEHKRCSLCDAPYVDSAWRYSVWTKRVFGGDVVPLLCHLCSPECVKAVETEAFVESRDPSVGPSPPPIADFVDVY